MTFTKLSFDEVRALPIAEKIEYMRKVNLYRQKRYRENNKEKHKENSKKYAKKYKERNYNKCKENAKKNSKKYRDKMRQYRLDLQNENRNEFNLARSQSI